MSKGHSCYRPRRDGERKRKSVRGCIVDANLSVLALVIVRKGAQVSSLTMYKISINGDTIVTLDRDISGYKLYIP